MQAGKQALARLWSLSEEAERNAATGLSNDLQLVDAGQCVGEKNKDGHRRARMELLCRVRNWAVA